MRVVLADLKSNRGFVSKDTVVGGYGSRLDPFSRVTTVMAYLKRQFHDVPSVHMAYVAAILARAGPRGDVDARRAGGRRRRARAVVARRSQERNGVGRPDARARRQGRLHRHHRVEDAGAVRRPLRLHPERRARSRRDAAGAGRASRRASSSASRSTISIRCRSRAGTWSPRIAPEAGHQVVVAAGRRRLSRCSRAAAARSSAPTARTGFWPAIARARSRTSSTRWSGCATRYRRPYVIFRDPLFTRAARARASSCATRSSARGLKLTFEAETRLDRLDVELLDKLYAAGLPRDELRRRIARPGDAEEVGAAADSARRTSARSSSTAASCGIVTAAFYVLGFLQDDWNSIAATIDYATDLGSTFAQFKILTPYPGTPMFKQLEPLLTETDWEKFDGYTPTFKHPEPDRARAAVPARRRLQAVLHAAVVSRELPEDPERGDPRVGQPDGSARQRSALARGDRRHLAPSPADATDRDMRSRALVSIAC